MQWRRRCRAAELAVDCRILVTGKKYIAGFINLVEQMLRGMGERKNGTRHQQQAYHHQVTLHNIFSIQRGEHSFEL